MPRSLYVILTLGALIALWLKYGAAWYHNLPTADQISVWVAVGTIGLALATVASVYETTRILASEDVRHQESYAPILTLEAKSEYPGYFGFYIRNTGLGPALKIRLILEGIYEDYQRRRASPPDQVPPRFENVKISEEPLLKDQPLQFVIHTPGSRDVSFDIPTPSSGANRKPVLRVVKVEYEDVFGNPYSTVYSDVAKATYVWFKPNIRSRRKR